MTTQTNNPTDSVSTSEAETESSITIHGVATGNNETYTARINLYGTLETWVPSHSPPNPDVHISTAGITETAADTYAKIAHIPDRSSIYVSPDAYSNRVAITANRPVPHRERFDAQYRDIIAEILLEGITQGNRTGEPSRWIPTATVKVDLQKEFPILNLRKIYPKQAIGEMLGFLRGYTNSQHFEEIGCKYWHANANLPTKGSDTSPWLSSRHRLGKNDLGEIYGDLWRHWVGDDGMVVDQVADVVEAIHRTPDSRRILVTGWKPESVKQVRGALPPCHVMWQVMVDTQKRELHLSWTQR
ncbi:MAG: thymidylate synthase [Candidatus Nanopelagicales bacterium]|nr:thymidylate synthase [Candidatus Nanopelagicales bacterium]